MTLFSPAPLVIATLLAACAPETSYASQPTRQSEGPSVVGYWKLIGIDEFPIARNNPADEIILTVTNRNIGGTSGCVSFGRGYDPQVQELTTTSPKEPVESSIPMVSFYRGLSPVERKFSSIFLDASQYTFDNSENLCIHTTTGVVLFGRSET